jgi:lipoic acid synthetase
VSPCPAPNPTPDESARPTRRPSWLRVPARDNPGFHRLKRLLRSQGLHTVCEEANCPNISECWSRGTATFLILGDTCTRSCRFCNVKTGRPDPSAPREGRRVAQAVQALRLGHVVVTSVDRDDLADGGAEAFTSVVREIRSLRPSCTIEVLIPDFRGRVEPLVRVLEAQPDIIGHNVDTTPGLFATVRPQCRYSWSLATLRKAKELRPEGVTKSGLMLGLGETTEEVISTMAGLREVGVDCLTLGQYLQPTRRHAAISRYYAPQEFDELRRRGEEMGFRWVESGPLVRSSYNAGAQAQALLGDH